MVVSKKRFKTAKEAIRDWRDTYVEEANFENVECLSNIYKAKDGFGYNPPSRGGEGEKEMNTQGTYVPKGTTFVGQIHSHFPGCLPNFSPKDSKSIKKTYEDWDWNGVSFYVVNPAGKVLVWNRSAFGGLGSGVPFDVDEYDWMIED